MTEKIHITPVNEVYCRAASDDRGVNMQLFESFRFLAQNYRFHPLFRAKKWNGYINLYNLFNGTIYRGLIPRILKFAESQGYDVELHPALVQKNSNHELHQLAIEKWIENEIQPTKRGDRLTADYFQKDAVSFCTSYNRGIIVSPTASGKSLIIYCLIRYYLDRISPQQKILIVVPTTSLVEQMVSDFADYSSINKWDAEENCHKIYSGREKIADAQVFISTWQSIYKKDKQWYSQFDAVIVDEVHKAKCNSITGLMEKLVDCKVRIGLTGTLDGIPTNQMTLEGLFGEIKQVVTTRKLIDMGRLPELDIDCIVLKYPEDEAKAVKHLDYHGEIDYICKHQKRLNFVSDLVCHIKSNTMVLYNYIEHGENIYNSLLSKTKRKVFLVHGQTDVEDREAIRKIMSTETDAIIVASYGTFSTGINIDKLYNIVFASPSKSRIRVLQSIGRGLRKMQGKVKCKLYDVVDDFQYLKHKNTVLKHFIERLKIYSYEKFKYKVVQIKV